MDIIPKVTQLSLFLQTETIDLAMIRPTVDSVIQQLTYLKSNDGNYLSEFMTVASARKMSEFKGVKVSDTPVLRAQFQKVRHLFLTNIIFEIERRFPAEATDMISCMSVLSLRGLSVMSEEDRKEYGVSQLETMMTHYGNTEGDAPSFIDVNETRHEWEMCKGLIMQQKYPCHTIQSTWKLLTSWNNPKFNKTCYGCSVGTSAN